MKSGRNYSRIKISSEEDIFDQRTSKVDTREQRVDILTKTLKICKHERVSRSEESRKK